VKAATSFSDHNKQTVHEYAQAYGRGDYETILKLCTPDVVVQGVLGKGGMDIVLPIWKELHHAFNQQLIVQEMIGEGDTVAVLLTERGTFRNEFRGMKPTGKNYEIVAMEWFHLRDGKIAERWGARDSATIMRQVGAQ